VAVIRIREASDACSLDPPPHIFKSCYCISGTRPNPVDPHSFSTRDDVAESFDVELGSTYEGI
jgi:hypothetical protein